MVGQDEVVEDVVEVVFVGQLLDIFIGIVFGFEGFYCYFGVVVLVVEVVVVVVFVVVLDVVQLEVEIFC